MLLHPLAVLTPLRTQNLGTLAIFNLAEQVQVPSRPARQLHGLAALPGASELRVIVTQALQPSEAADGDASAGLLRALGHLPLAREAGVPAPLLLTVS